MPAAMPGQRGTRRSHSATPQAALEVLQAGNKRFLEGKLEQRDYSPVTERFASEQAANARPKSRLLKPPNRRRAPAAPRRRCLV